MTNLADERRRVLAELKAAGLTLDVWADEVDDLASTVTPIHTPIRLYLASDALGGVLAVNHRDGWYPCYPARPTRGLRGHWYSPSSTDWEASDWKLALLAALCPETYLTGREFARTIARTRAQAIRNPLAVALTVIKLLEGQDR